MYDMKKVMDTRVRSKCRIAHRKKLEVLNPFKEETPEWRCWESESDKIFYERLNSSGLRGITQ